MKKSGFKDDARARTARTFFLLLKKNTHTHTHTKSKNVLKILNVVQTVWKKKQKGGVGAHCNRPLAGPPYTYDKAVPENVTVHVAVEVDALVKLLRGGCDRSANGDVVTVVELCQALVGVSK